MLANPLKRRHNERRSRGDPTVTWSTSLLLVRLGSQRENRASVFRHLKSADSPPGCDDYGLGELWEKNVSWRQALTVRKVLILVEGQTEERFVKDVLQPHLWSREIHPEPKIVTTKVVKVGPQFKGGVSTFRKIETDILRLLGDSVPRGSPQCLTITGCRTIFRAREDLAAEIRTNAQRNWRPRPKSISTVGQGLCVPQIHESWRFSRPPCPGAVINAPCFPTD